MNIGDHEIQYRRQARLLVLLALICALLKYERFELKNTEK